jgi:hypothetical protein
MTNSVIANSNRDSMGGDFGLDLSWGYLHALDNRDMGHGTSSSKTSIGKSSIGKSSIRKTTIGKELGISLGLTLSNVVAIGKTIAIGTYHRGGMGNNGGSNNRTDRSVVDERGGGGQDLGGSSKDGWVSISRPLANIVTGETVAKAVVADSNRDSMGGDFGLDLSWGHFHALDNRDMGHGTSSSKTSIGKSSIRKTTIDKLRVSLWGSQGHGS